MSWSAWRRKFRGIGFPAAIWCLGSEYQDYPDCPRQIRETAVKAMDILDIRFGSLDIIEGSSGFSVIDANAVSNASEDNTEMFHFDLMKETAQYIARQYRKMKKEKGDA